LVSLCGLLTGTAAAPDLLVPDLGGKNSHRKYPTVGTLVVAKSLSFDSGCGGASDSEVNCENSSELGCEIGSEIACETNDGLGSEIGCEIVTRTALD
jgi:hypothetical protein